MRMRRRLILAFVVMAAAVLLASGVAVAAVLHGTDSSERINGTNQADEIYGHGGNDTIYGLAGNDGLDGQIGNDTVYGMDGADQIFGGVGHDTLDGGPGIDRIHGSHDNDTLRGADGDDVLFGGTGIDNIDGGAGVDTIDGSYGDDTVTGGIGNDKLYGGDDTDTINGDEGDDTIYGNAGDDTLDGGAEKDTLYGGAGNDTLDAGPSGDTALDTLNGEDGDDTIKAVNLPAFADIVNCGPGSEDEATVDPLDTEDLLGTAEDRCENMLRISERTGDRVSGYFDKQGNQTHVEFESYVDIEEEGPLGILVPPEEKHPYDRATTSVITLDDDKLLGDEDRVRLKLTVNPETKTIKQRITTPEGSQKKLSDDDRKAIRKAGELLSELLDRKGRGDCNIKNQETLAIRHFAQLTSASRDLELKDFDNEYQDPENKCGSRTSSASSTALSTKNATSVSTANILTKGATSVGTRHCMAGLASRETRPATNAGLVKTVGLAKPVDARVQYVPLQSDYYDSNGNDGITLLPCDLATGYGSYYDYYGGYGYSESIYGPASGNDIGRCGPADSYFLQYAYTQDCLDHDVCVAGLEAEAYSPIDDDCGHEFADAADDFVVGYAIDPIGCNPFTSSTSSLGTKHYGSPKAVGPGNFRKA